MKGEFGLLILAIWVSGMPLAAYCIGKHNKIQKKSWDKLPVEMSLMWPFLFCVAIFHYTIAIPLTKLMELGEK